MHRVRLVSFVLLVVCTTGCTDPTIGVVRGTVTIDGELAKTGSISFFPVDGNGQTAGAAIVDGAYEATVSVGICRVEIRVPKKVGEIKIYDTPDSPIQDDMRESLPPKYNDESELQYEVQPGKSEKDFELSTKKAT